MNPISLNPKATPDDTYWADYRCRKCGLRVVYDVVHGGDLARARALLCTSCAHLRDIFPRHVATGVA